TIEIRARAWLLDRDEQVRVEQRRRRGAIGHREVGYSAGRRPSNASRNWCHEPRTAEASVMPGKRARAAKGYSARQRLLASLFEVCDVFSRPASERLRQESPRAT